MDISNIINSILKNEDKIKLNFDDDDIEIYLFIMNEYQANKLTNPVARFVYSSFYGINQAGFSKEMKKKYFEMLAELKNDIGYVLIELHQLPNRKGQNTYQFSFATKLLHTVDSENNPIWDNQIEKILEINLPSDKTTQGLVNKYTELKEIYKTLLSDKKLIDIINKIFPVNNDKYNRISNLKKLDFILWGLGKSKESNTSHSL